VAADPAPEELAPGVLVLPTTGRDNAFAVPSGTPGDPDALTLVDVGWAGAPERIERLLAAHGRALSQVRRVVVTHAHPDHVRGLAGLRARTGAEVLVHGADARWLAAGRVPGTGRSGAAGRLLDRLPLLHWAPVTADRLIDDGETLPGDLRVVHTPGHSPGHVALLHEPSGALLVGDAVFHRGGTLSLGPSALAADPVARDAALGRMPAGVSAVGFAHGPALRGPEVDRFRRLLDAGNRS
jgi:glyoxylase-like metal-dependent hydrolase (beta-lactamase superfamily II)